VRNFFNTGMTNIVNVAMNNVSDRATFACLTPT